MSKVSELQTIIDILTQEATLKPTWRNPPGPYMKCLDVWKQNQFEG